MNAIYRNRLGPIMRGWGCGFKWTWSHPFQPMCPAGSYCLLFRLQLPFVIHRSSSPGETMRAIESSECPLGTEMSVIGPRSSSSSGLELWGGFWSVLSSDVWLHQWSGSLASKSSDMAFFFRDAGAAESSSMSVSMLSSLSSSMTTSESCWRRLSSIMEMSLVPSPSNNGGCESRLGLPSIVEQHLCHSSSFCTWSSQVMEEEWPSSMASLKAICWALDSSAVLSHNGRGRVGNFHSWGPDESWGDLPLRVWDDPFLLLWLCHSFTLCPLQDSLWDQLGFVTSGSHSTPPRSSCWDCRRNYGDPPRKFVCICRHILISYWDLLSIPWKKRAQTCAIWSRTP